MPLRGGSTERARPSFRAAALRTGGITIGFVGLVALLFAGVGMFQDRDTADAGIGSPAAPPVVVEPVAPVEPDTVDDADMADDEDAESVVDAEQPAPATPPPAPTPPPPPATGPSPSSIDVQVLNGYSADGGTAAGRIADQLAAAGFNIRARDRQALPYAETTVFYIPGREAEGRRVAQEIGARIVLELTPERRLSPDVMVHVVVGADRG
jgi:hypothetical protein